MDDLVQCHGIIHLRESSVRFNPKINNMAMTSWSRSQIWRNQITLDGDDDDSADDDICMKSPKTIRTTRLYHRNRLKFSFNLFIFGLALRSNCQWKVAAIRFYFDSSPIFSSTVIHLLFSFCILQFTSQMCLSTAMFSTQLESFASCCLLSHNFRTQKSSILSIRVFFFSFH